MKNAIITGGSGYFGECLINYLNKKDIKTYSLDINQPANKKNITEFLHLNVLDLKDNLSFLKDKDVLFHCVANVPLAKNKKLFYKNNVEGTIAVLDACLKTGIKKVVILSSSAVYGIPNSNPVDENTLPKPMEEYGKAKLESEKICFREKYKSIDISIIRPRTILGHGRLGIFEILFDWIKQGYNIPVLNGGNNIYQFIHADDLANACFLSTNTKGINIFNCGTDNYSSIKDVLEYLCTHAKTGSKVKSLPMWIIEPLMKISSTLNISPLAPYHSLMYGRSLYFDNKKIKRLGWKSMYSNNQMFIESYEYYLKNYEYMINDSILSDHKKKVKRKILNVIKYII
tara:strand:+ start:942 stop:1970 length:1029 start_codon:yes stop_codon:yes gene_type:complete